MFRLSQVVRPLIVAIVILTCAAVLNFPTAALVVMNAGALVGFIMGTIRGDKGGIAFALVAAISFILLMVVSSAVSMRQFDGLHGYAALSWFIGFLIVGVVTLVSQKES